MRPLMTSVRHGLRFEDSRLKFNLAGESFLEVVCGSGLVPIAKGSLLTKTCTTQLRWLWVRFGFRLLWKLSTGEEVTNFCRKPIIIWRANRKSNSQANVLVIDTYYYGCLSGRIHPMSMKQCVILRCDSRGGGGDWEILGISIEKENTFAFFWQLQ